MQVRRWIFEFRHLIKLTRLSISPDLAVPPSKWAVAKFTCRDFPAGIRRIFSLTVFGNNINPSRNAILPGRLRRALAETNINVIIYRWRMNNSQAVRIQNNGINLAGPNNAKPRRESSPWNSLGRELFICSTFHNYPLTHKEQRHT